MQAFRDAVFSNLSAAKRVVDGTLPDDLKIAVAVSGGSDSMALAEATRMVFADRADQLTLLHVHHGLRGKEADADARHVERYAKRQNLDFRLLEADRNLKADSDGESVQMAARAMRRRLLVEAATDFGAEYTLLGHHRDDQAENILLALGRGAGLDGVSAMLAIGPGPFLRPFLDFTKEEIQAALHRHKLTWREDSSNKSNDYERGKVRKVLLPAFSYTFGKDCSSHLAKAAELLRQDREFIVDVVREQEKSLLAGRGSFWCGWHREALVSAHKSLASRVLRDAFFSLYRQAHPNEPTPRLEHRHTEAILASLTDGRLPRENLPRNVAIELDNDALWMYLEPEPSPIGVQLHVDAGTEAKWELPFERGVLTTVDAAGLANEWTVVVTKEAFSIGLWVSNYTTNLSKEYVQLPGATKRKSVQKLLSEQSVPKFLRRRLPRVIDTEGNVQAVFGLQPQHAKTQYKQNDTVILRLDFPSGNAPSWS